MLYFSFACVCARCVLGQRVFILFTLTAHRVRRLPNGATAVLCPSSVCPRMVERAGSAVEAHALLWHCTYCSSPVSSAVIIRFSFFFESLPRRGPSRRQGRGRGSCVC